LVTGHQPYLFHPGIWLKYLLVDRIARDRGWVALSMSVDTDVAEDIGADAPRRDERGLHLVHETLIRVGADVPYEAVAAPAAADWQTFVDRLHRNLATIPLPDAMSALQAFASAAGTPKGAATVGAFLTTARRRYEGNRSYGDLPVSLLGATGEFKRFVWHLLCDAEKFAAVYNRDLAQYRDRYNVRTPAQPFPDLGRDADRQELPLWIFHNQRREPLFAQRRGRAVRVFAGTTRVLDAEEAAGPDVLRDVSIRPRAMTLTLFARLCMADLLVHGVGGGRYDRVTDAVIRDYFEMEPPAYAVATATLHLPLQAFDPATERQALQSRLLEIQHNPDRLITHPTPGQQAQISEKRALIAALDGATLSRRERRETTHRIREINEILARTLTDELEEVKSRQAHLEGGDGSAAATYRSYPYCFFPPRDVDVLIDGLLDQSG
jgi:hypothetical protein